MYLWTLAAYEKAWGLDHTSTLNTVNNLGSIYKQQDQIVETEAMYLRTLVKYEKTWKSDHIFMLVTAYNRRSLYMQQGKMAEPMYLWECEIWKSLGTRLYIHTRYSDLKPSCHSKARLALDTWGFHNLYSHISAEFLIRDGIFLKSRTKCWYDLETLCYYRARFILDTWGFDSLYSCIGAEFLVGDSIF